jgi:hypothetical protein
LDAYTRTLLTSQQEHSYEQMCRFLSAKQGAA